MRTVCIITGSRADYGLLRWVMKEVHRDHDLKLQVIASGMHLSPEFGLTYRDIEADGFVIDRKLEMLTSSDSASGVTKSIGLGVIAFADAFNQLQPDIVLLLGDRFEIFSAATAALVAGLPIAHLHGGEVTEGAFDEALRHAITKMSHLHFVAAEPYRRRVLQMGESPENVFLCGGLGVDNIRKTPILSRIELESSIDFRLGKRNLLVTFHPVTLEPDTTPIQMGELLRALDSFRDIHLILTMPNADTGGRELITMIEQFVATRPNARAYKSLGQLRYLSCMAHVDGVIGNSSSGLTEAPSLKKGSVNIGNRQRGRLKARSVIDCEPSFTSILAAIETLYSPSFQASLKDLESPYGNGGASEKIVDVLKSYDLDNITKKSFCDVPPEWIRKDQ